MKIDAVLARHPWPWVAETHNINARRRWWMVVAANGVSVFDDGSSEGELIYACDVETRDAILELVEAHVKVKEGKETKP